MGFITVIITLTSFGDDIGPIDIYTDSDGYTTPIETGLNVALFATGYHCNVVPDDATNIRLQSTGVCDTVLNLSIGSLPTPTPTPSVTPPTTPTQTPTQTPTSTPTPSNTPAPNTYTISFSPVVMIDLPQRQVYKSFVQVTPTLPAGHSFRLYFENYTSADASSTLEGTINGTADKRFVTGGYNNRSQSFIEEGNSGFTSDIVNASHVLDSNTLFIVYFNVDATSHIGNQDITHEVVARTRMVTVDEETGGGTYIIDPVNYYLEAKASGPWIT